jgi:hypothetical protein
MRFAFACLVGVVLVALPAAAQNAGSLRTREPVRALAADGTAFQVAFMTSAVSGGCGAIWAWRPGKPVRRLGPTPCGPATSTGRGLYGLSFSTDTALWASYTGGNFREHTVWFAPRLRRARPIKSVSHNVDSPSPLVIGEGDGAFSTFAVGDELNTATPDLLNSWKLEGPAASVAVSGPYALARLQDGPIVFYRRWGGPVEARFDYQHRVALAVKSSGDRVVVLRKGVLDVLDVHRGLLRSWPLPAARSYGDDHCGSVTCPLARLRLADLQGQLAAYVRDRDVHVVRVSDGKDVRLRRAAVGPVHAQLEPGGLVYSAGRGVYVIPRAELDRRLR